MVNEESNYRRIEDEKWRESVSTRLVSLTDSEVTQNDRLDEVDGEIHTIREMLEGRPSDRDDNGIKGDLHDLSVGVSELRRLMMPDHLGQGGILIRLKALEKKAGIEEHDLDNRWKFKTAVAVAIVSAIALVLTNLDRIEPPLKKLFKAQTEESRPLKKRSGKTSKRRPKAVATPTEATDNGASNQEMPDGRSGDGSHSE